jgi:hypothetical protein
MPCREANDNDNMNDDNNDALKKRGSLFRGGSGIDHRTAPHQPPIRPLEISANLHWQWRRRRAAALV